MKRSERLRPFLLAALVVLLWTLAVRQASTLEPYARGVSARWTEGVSPAELVRAERRIVEDGGEPPSVTLHSTPASRAVLLDDRETDAEITTVYGDADAVEPRGFLVGAHPARGDRAVSISNTLAESLAGSAEILGAELTIDGAKYPIRGVFDCDEPRALLMLGDDDGEKLCRAVISTDEGVDFAETALSRFGFPSAELCDLALVGWLTRAVSALPAAVMLALALSRLVGHALRLRFWPMLLCRFLPLAVLAAAALFFAAGAPFSIPARLIPSRYSDFEFWGRLFGRSIGALVGDISASPRALDMALSLGGTTLFATAAAVIAPSFLRSACGSGDRLAVCAVSGLLAAVATLLLRTPADRAVIFLPTVCAAVISILKTGEERAYEAETSL